MTQDYLPWKGRSLGTVMSSFSLNGSTTNIFVPLQRHILPDTQGLLEDKGNGNIFSANEQVLLHTIPSNSEVGSQFLEIMIQMGPS